MIFEGRIAKDGKFWLAEIPALDFLTQGKSYKEALEMAKDIVETAIEEKGFEVTVTSISKDSFLLVGNRSRPMIALLLQRLRQKHGLTLREVAKRLGSSSPNAFSCYERGEVAPTMEKLEQLIRAVDPSQEIVFKLV